MAWPSRRVPVFATITKRLCAMPFSPVVAPTMASASSWAWRRPCVAESAERTQAKRLPGHATVRFSETPPSPAALPVTFTCAFPSVRRYHPQRNKSFRSVETKVAPALPTPCAPAIESDCRAVPSTRTSMTGPAPRQSPAANATTIPRIFLISL